MHEGHDEEVNAVEADWTSMRALSGSALQMRWIPSTSKSRLNNIAWMFGKRSGMDSSFIACEFAIGHRQQKMRNE